MKQLGGYNSGITREEIVWVWGRGRGMTNGEIQRLNDEGENVLGAKHLVTLLS